MNSRTISLLALLTLLTLTGCARSQTAVAAAPPSPGDPGEAILRRACTTCHDLEGLSAYADSWGAGEWRVMVETMVGYGASVTPEEVETLAAWLGENYGVTAEARSLTNSACTTCHDLTALTTGTYDRAGLQEVVQRMIGYGAAVAPGQIDMLVGYLEETYPD
jgi:cytochrome c5